ncbi:MAG: AraC family ligand binding domain-containing protein, partial [Desulfopila sp.]|nr:AraC family ligand binding domain-containing protein [Desulfopila sp.]
MKKDRFYQDSRLPFVECRYTHDSSEVFKPHLHRSFSVGGVEQGEIDFLIGESAICLEKGTLALINPDTLHSCNPAGHGARSFYMLYFKVEWCIKIQHSLWENAAFIPVDCAIVKDPVLYSLFVDTVRNL